jgi:hypothetical protein
VGYNEKGGCLKYDILRLTGAGSFGDALCVADFGRGSVSLATVPDTSTLALYGATQSRGSGTEGRREVKQTLASQKLGLSHGAPMKSLTCLLSPPVVSSIKFCLTLYF